MLETVIYEFSNLFALMITFITTVIIITLICYYFTEKVEISDRDLKVHGLFIGLENREITMVSLIFIRSYLIIFRSIKYTENIMIYVVMLIIVSLIYIILQRKFKIAIYEILNTGAQIFAIYFINILDQYSMEVADTNYVTIIKVCLIIFIIAYSIYSFLRDFEEIIPRENKKKKEAKLNGKQIKQS